MIIFAQNIKMIRMRQLIKIFFSLSCMVLSGQNDVLVVKNGNPYITVEDFKNKFGYTLDHDKTQSKEAILDYYLTIKLKSDEAQKLNLDNTPEFVNPIIKFIDARRPFYLEQDPFYKRMQQQFIERSKVEVQIVQYFVKDIDKKQALNYQKKLSKGKNLFKRKGNVVRIESKYYTAGELPYNLEEEIFTNLEKGSVLEVQEAENNQYVYTVVNDIRPYSGTYKFQLLLIKDSLKTGKAKIDSLYKQVIQGSSFDRLVKTFSEDEKSKEKPFITFKGIALDNEVLSVMNSLNKNEISKPFKTEFGWNLIKLKEHDTLFDENAIVNKFKNSLEYDIVLKGYKVNYIDEKLSPVEKNNTIVTDLKNEKLIELFKKDSISKEDYEKQLVDIVVKEIDKKNIVEFSNGLSYTNWNFISDNLNFLKMLYKTEADELEIEKRITTLLPISINQFKVQLFNNKQDTFNSEFKKEVELLKINILTELYDKYQYKRALNDKEALLKEYQRLKANYKWDKRVEVIIAYCGSDKRIAKEIEKSLKENKTIEQLQQQYKKKDVYFRRMKRELSSKDLPKGYLKTKETRIYEEDEDYFVTKTVAFLPSQDPTYEELRSIVEKEYQKTFLNGEISKLKESTQINQKVLNNL